MIFSLAKIKMYTKTHKVTIDLVTEHPETGDFVMVAVEEGPWSPEEVLTQLQRLQDRLYDFVDAAIDGYLAAEFPESKGRNVTIRLDCYNIPEEQVAPFFRRFEEKIEQSEEVNEVIRSLSNVSRLRLELNCRHIH